jgi:hypothetical protein
MGELHSISITKGAEDVGGRSHDNVASFLGRSAAPVAKQPCSRVMQLLVFYLCIVMFTAFAVAGAGVVHIKTRNQKTRYQKGKESAMQAFAKVGRFWFDPSLTPA